jgi:hypothetical protein
MVMRIRQLREWLVRGWQMWLLAGLLAACGLGPGEEPTAVPPSGIPVAPVFLPFYQTHGGERVLGGPISELFDGENGRSLQYFRNLRLEHDPASGAVSAAPLGEWALAGLTEQSPAPTPESSPARTFPNTSFTLQDQFRIFYESYAGEVLLGPPISPQLNVDGLRVQYFTNGRLEWRPEAPPDWRIQLSPLGQNHFDQEMRFVYQANRDARPVSSAGVSAVNINAYVRAPVLYAGESQTLYVTVTTPGGDPVTGLVLDLNLSYAEFSERIVLGPTDDNGQIAAPLATVVEPGQQVLLRVQARDGNGQLIGERVTTYRTWW